MKSHLRDISVCLPEMIISNEDLQQEFPGWNLDLVAQRAGVRQRRIAREDETALDLGEKACQQLFDRHPSLPQSLDVLLFCTQSPDYLLPPNACVLHGRLKLPETVTAFDMNHACSGFVYALALADCMIRSGYAKNVVLVNADTYSKYINKADRSTRVLFGDGAAASWIQASQQEAGVIDVVCGTAGGGFDKFMIPAGGCRLKKSPQTAVEAADDNGNVRSQENIHMAGRAILGFVNSKIPRHVRNVLEKNSLDASQVDLYVFHQASATVLDSLTRLLKIDPTKVFRNLENIGNTVSASIPIAIHEALQTKRILRGDTLFVCGFGVGLSWGSAVIRL